MRSSCSAGVGGEADGFHVFLSKTVERREDSALSRETLIGIFTEASCFSGQVPLAGAHKYVGLGDNKYFGSRIASPPGPFHMGTNAKGC